MGGSEWEEEGDEAHERNDKGRFPKVLVFGIKRREDGIESFVYDAHLPEEETPVEDIMNRIRAIDVLGWIYVLRGKRVFREHPEDGPLIILTYDHESKYYRGHPTLGRSGE